MEGWRATPRPGTFKRKAPLLGAGMVHDPATRGVSMTPPPHPFHRAVGLLLWPSREWAAIADTEPNRPAEIWLRHTSPLTAMGAVASAIGFVAFGVDGARLSGANVASLLTAQFVGGLVLVAVMSLVVLTAGPLFGAPLRPARALEVAAYGATPTYFLALATVYPPLAPFAAAIGAILAVRCIFLGVRSTTKLPALSAGAYTLLIVLVMLSVEGLAGLAAAFLLR